MNEFFYDSHQLIFSFLIPGIVLGAIYDVFRIIRFTRVNTKGNIGFQIKKHFELNTDGYVQKSKRSLNVLIFFEDFIFCIIGTFIELLLFYHLNAGVIRIYAILISAVGFFIYQNSIGYLIIYVAQHIIYCIRYLIYYILIVVLTPFICIYKNTKIKKEDRKKFEKEK